MLLETWLAYSLAALIIIVIPGPTVLLVVSQSVSYGARAAFPLVAGVALGDLTAMTLSLLGLGLVLKSSAVLFNTIKWAGAAYLVYLGVKMWRTSDPQQMEQVARKREWTKHLANAYWVTVFNPKGIVFFLAFIPQFIDPTKTISTQLIIFGATFLVIATISAAAYALFAVQLGQIMTGDTFRKWFQRAGGTVLIGAGAVTALMRQN